MFNKSLNLSTFVKDIPSMNIRKSLMLSLVGSINHTVVSNADAMASRLANAGYDLRDLETRDVALICKSIDDDVFGLRKAMAPIIALRDEWEQMLQASDLGRRMFGPNDIVRKRGAQEAAPIGSIQSALDSACGPQKARVVVNEEAEAELLQLGIATTDADRMKAARNAQITAQFFANQRAERRGFIEWVVEHVFGTSTMEDPFLQLTLEQREFYAAKAHVALRNMSVKAADNFRARVTKDDALGIADIPIIRRATEELGSLMYAEPTKRATKAHKAKLQRVTKDGTVIAATKKAQALTSGSDGDTPRKVKRTRNATAHNVEAMAATA